MDVEEEIAEVLHLEAEYSRLFAAGRLGNAPQFDRLLRAYRKERSWQERYLKAKWLVGVLPVLMVFGLVGFTYYSVLLDLVVPDVWPSHPAAALAVLTLYHLLLLLMMASYLRTVFSSPGHIPIGFIVANHIANASPQNPPTPRRRHSTGALPSAASAHQEGGGEGASGGDGGALADGGETGQAREEDDALLPHDAAQDAPVDHVEVTLLDSLAASPSDHLVGGADALPVQTRKQGGARVCQKCNKPKPDRSHHCRLCGRCVLKMDHHCPWVNNCVGWGNHKFFILFLVWTCAACLLTCAIVLPHLLITGMTNLKGPDIRLMATFIIAIIFFLCLTAFFISHVALILSNQTTIESMEKRNPVRRRALTGDASSLASDQSEYVRVKNAFDVGWQDNFHQVFGTNPLLWLLPIESSQGDGVYFPTNLAGRA